MGNVAALAHAGNRDAALGRSQQVDRLGEAPIKAVDQRGEPGDFHPQDAAGYGYGTIAGVFWHRSALSNRFVEYYRNERASMRGAIRRPILVPTANHLR